MLSAAEKQEKPCLQQGGSWQTAHKSQPLPTTCADMHAYRLRCTIKYFFNKGRRAKIKELWPLSIFTFIFPSSIDLLLCLLPWLTCDFINSSPELSITGLWNSTSLRLAQGLLSHPTHLYWKKKKNKSFVNKLSDKSLGQLAVPLAYSWVSIKAPGPYFKMIMTSQCWNLEPRHSERSCQFKFYF